MGMPLTLVSNHKNLEIRQHAKFMYRCDGKPRFRFKGDHSETCTNVIHRNEMYVAEIEWRDQRGTPRKLDVSKFCCHCALRLFVDIKIAGTHA